MGSEYGQLVGALSLGPEHEPLRQTLGLSAGSFDPAALWLRESAAVDEACRWIGLSDGLRSAFLEATPQVLENRALLRLLWHCHHRLFVSNAPAEEIWAWRPLPQTCGTLGKMFYPLVYLSGLPHVRRMHARRNIPEDVTRQTLRDMEIWMRDHHRRCGQWGLVHIWWSSTYFTGRLYQLGRLQFELGNFSLPFCVYEHRSTHEAIALVQPGLTLRADGQFADADGGRCAGGTWMSVLQERDGVIRGHAATSRGCVSPEPVSLPADQWQKILRPQDPTLIVHIPAGAPLDAAQCRLSFRQAMEFFPRHFPEHAFGAMWTCTWLLDPQLADHLPGESNIVRFGRCFRLLPIPGAHDGQTIERVFDRSTAPIEQLPQDTSLRRAIVRHMQAGGRWRMGGGIILPEDISRMET